jgi:hypothetical protein
MLTARDLSHGLYGAWRMAMLDRDAVKYFDASIDGFWKSFYAAAIVAPAVIIVTLFSVARADLPGHIGVFEIAVVKTSQYVIDWVLFPLLMISVGNLLQRGERYIGFIVAYNWGQVVQMAVVLPIFLLFIASGTSADTPNMLSPVLLFAIAFYYWFIARTALQIGGWAAAAVSALSLTLSGGIETIAHALLT